MHETTLTLTRAERVEARELELSRALDEYRATALVARVCRETGAPVPESLALAGLTWLGLECLALDAYNRLTRNASAPTGRTESLERGLMARKHRRAPWRPAQQTATDPITRGAGRFLIAPVTFGSVAPLSKRDAIEARIVERERRAEMHRERYAPLTPEERAMKARAARRKRRKR